MSIAIYELHIDPVFDLNTCHIENVYQNLLKTVRKLRSRQKCLLWAPCLLTSLRKRKSVKQLSLADCQKRVWVLRVCRPYIVTAPIFLYCISCLSPPPPTTSIRWNLLTYLFFLNNRLNTPSFLPPTSNPPSLVLGYSLHYLFLKRKQKSTPIFVIFFWRL